MAAFIRRRWILLSCALVLFACTMFDWRKSTHGRIDGTKRLVWKEYFGLYQGSFVAQIPTASKRLDCWTHIDWHIHVPAFGEFEKCYFGPSGIKLHLALWLPLSIIIGWLVFRELRWREKRARDREGGEDGVADGAGKGQQ